jgi:hypothetical protein
MVEARHRRTQLGTGELNNSGEASHSAELTGVSGELVTGEASRSDSTLPKLQFIFFSGLGTVIGDGLGVCASLFSETEMRRKESVSQI